jgi:acyl carrier protein
MELNEFLKKFKEQYIDGDEIVLDSDMDFRKIDSYDSLTGMSIIVMIKDEFDMDITNEKWKELRSVKEVYNYILSEHE